MHEIINFLQDIFMIKEVAPQSVGLSQFKHDTVVEKPKKEKSIRNKDIKLSDLMRRH